MTINELKNTSTMDYNEFWENPTMQASEQLAPLPAEIFIANELENELIELNLYQF